MNKFVEIYKDKRSSSNNLYECFGIAANYVAANGSYEDLKILYDALHDDLMEETDKLISEAENFLKGVTSDEIAMREAGHKLSDFE